MDKEFITYKEQSETPFVLGNQIGAGPSVVVRMAKNRNEKKWPYAQKTVGLGDDDVEKAKREFVREVKTLRHAQHHHVVKLLDAFAVEGVTLKLAIVMDRAAGSLQDFVSGKRRKKSDLVQIQQWFGCLASVVDYIHGIGIRHRDIKPANILVHERKIQLADFGISQMGLGKTLSTTVPQWARDRTTAYCAPEVDQGSSRGRSADIFSLGAVFLEMLVAHSYPLQLQGLRKMLAYEGGPSYAKRIAEVQAWMTGLEKDIKQTPEGDWHRGILSLCGMMLHEDRDQRPTAPALITSLSGSEALPPCKCSSPESIASRLVEACKKGDEDGVRLLVNSGAVPGTIGAIHQASARGHLAIFRYLLDYDAGIINLLDHSNQTALHCAAGNQQEAIVDVFLRRNATATLQDVEGRTALHYAAGCGSVSIVDKLLESMRAHVDIMDENGQTALHFAAKRGHKAVVERLLLYADPSTKDSGGRTALHFAAGYGSKAAVEMLLRKADPNAEDRDASTALHFAAKGMRKGGQYKEVIEMLLRCGVDPTKQDSNGHPASYFAKRNESPGWEILRQIMSKSQLADNSQIVLQTKTSEESRDTNVLGAFHPDLMSFIALVQYYHVDMWPISWDTDLEMLGRGATGDVMQSSMSLKDQFAFKRFASHRRKQPQVASPDISDVIYQTNDKLFVALIAELKILGQLEIRHHPHIVDIQGVAFDVQSSASDVPEVWPVLVMKKAHHGSFQKYMSTKRGKATDLPTRLQYCAQIGSALSTMHSNDVVHGDIKPANVLAYADEESVCAKVTDFSYSCIGKHEDDLLHVPKSEPWNAPEHRHSEVRIRDAKLMDIYSFGMVCLWLLFPKAFDELLDARREGQYKGYGQWCIQTVAATLALEEGSLSPSSRQSLSAFFSNTLCKDPRERRSDLPGLIGLLGHRPWQPQDGHKLFDDTRRPTLADYNATNDDIEDPVKLQVLLRRILHSLHMAGKDYDLAQGLHDSANIPDGISVKAYINYLFEGMGRFGVLAPGKDDEIMQNLIHSCINIAPSFFQLIMLDYRVRRHIAAGLRERANGPCEQCARAAAAELALWYTIGFGVHSDLSKAHMWLSKSDITDDQLHERLDGLKRLTISEYRFTAYTRSDFGGTLFLNYLERYGRLGLNSAEVHISREVHDLEHHLGKDHWPTFELKLELVELISLQNREGEGMKLLQDVRQSLKEKYESEHELHIRLDLRLASLYREQGLFTQAESLLEAAKSDIIEMSGRQHCTAIQICLELAIVYAEQRKDNEAEKEFVSLQEVVRETLPAGHLLATKLTEHHAGLLEKHGRMTEADLVWSRHANEGGSSGRFRALMREHNRGRSARLIGNLKEAERILLKVQRDSELLAEQEDQPIGHDSIAIAPMTATRNLALVYRDQNDFQKAETLQRALKEKAETELGKLDPLAIDVGYDLARTFEMQEQWLEAEKLQLEVKKGRTTVHGSQHERTTWASERLVTIYDMQGKLEDAEREMEEVRNAYAQRLGAIHTETMEATRELGLMYLRHGKLELAEENISMALSISKDVLGLYAELTLGAVSNLGVVYFSQGRLEEAEELLKRAREEMLKHLGPDHRFTKINENALALLDEQQEKFQEMSRLQEHDQSVSRPAIYLRLLSEDEQIQIALEQSLQTDLGPLEDMDDDSDDDLERAIAMSLEKEDDIEPLSEQGDDDDLRMAIAMSLEKEEEEDLMSH